MSIDRNILGHNQLDLNLKNGMLRVVRKDIRAKRENFNVCICLSSIVRGLQGVYDRGSPKKTNGDGGRL